MTFSSPSWRSLSLSKRLLNHPQKVTKNCQVVGNWILEKHRNFQSSPKKWHKTPSASQITRVKPSRVLHRRDHLSNLLGFGDNRQGHGDALMKQRHTCGAKLSVNTTDIFGTIHPPKFNIGWLEPCIFRCYVSLTSMVGRCIFLLKYTPEV